MSGMSDALHEKNKSSPASQRDFPAVVFGVSIDHKPGEAEVVVSGQKYQQFFQSSRDALMTFAGPSWFFTSCNPAAMELFGAKTEEEFFSWRPWDISPERQPDGQSSADNAREMIETAACEGSHLFEWQHQKIGGGEFPADVLLTCMEQKGNLLFQASVREISARKRTEEQLAHLNEQKDLILNSMSEGLLGLDLQGNHTFVNPAAARMLGYKPEELLGRPSHSTWHYIKPDGSPNPKEECPICSTYQTGMVHRLSTDVFQRKDGTSFPVEYVSTPIYEKGRLAGAVVTIVDITERKRAEEELRASDSKVRAITEAAKDAIIMMDPDGLISYWNPAAESIFGYRAEEAIGKNLHDLLAPEPHLSAHRAAYPEFQRTGQGNAIGKTVELSARRKDGQEIAASMSLAAVTLNGERHSVGIVRDISARKQMEMALSELNKNLEQRVRERTDALREQEAHLEAILEAAADGILAVDTNGRVMRASRRFTEIWKIPESLMKSGDDNALLDFITTQLSEPEAFLKKVQSLYDSDEESFDAIAFKDGRVAERYSFAMTMGGARIGRVWSFRDVTERKKNETLLANERALLRTLMAHLPVSIYLKDSAGLKTMANPVSLRNCGVADEAAVIGRTDFDFFAPEQAAAFLADDKQVLETGQPVLNREEMLTRPDGTTIWNLTSKVPLTDSAGHTVGLAGIGLDITEIRKAQEALRELNQHFEDAKDRAEYLAVVAEAANRAKSEFLGIMAHELRNPLNGVLGFAELLSDTSLDDEQKGYVRTISSSGEHLLAVVNDTLDLSSIEKGAMTICPAPFDLAHLLKLSSEIIRKSAADKGVAFRCDVAADVPAQITGDERRIRQILINLLANAVKFTSDGSVSLRLTRTGEFLDFSVEDTGLGISSEALARLFQLFTQADSTIGQKYGGTGLGLAVSQRLAEAMGGSISVVSVPGKGSTFTFRFPLEVPAGVMDSVRSHLFLGADGASPSSPDALPVLVVEDDRNSSTLAGKMLQSLGYRAEFAGNGAEAVEAFAPGKYLAILMDLRMPVMNGFEAVAIIRSRESGSRVPIIAHSANVMPGSREIYLAAGMDDFLSKPFKREELAAKLACVIQVS